jgi:hypothetical protein
MKSKRYAICAILAGGLAYGLIDLGCDGKGSPAPFPIPDAGHVGQTGPGPFDGGQTPDDASVFDAFNTPPPTDASSFPSDSGF